MKKARYGRSVWGLLGGVEVLGPAAADVLGPCGSIRKGSPLCQDANRPGSREETGEDTWKKTGFEVRRPPVEGGFLKKRKYNLMGFEKRKGRKGVLWEKKKKPAQIKKRTQGKKKRRDEKIRRKRAKRFESH